MGLDKWYFSSGSLYGANLSEVLGFLDLRSENRLRRGSGSSLWAVSLLKIGGALAFFLSLFLLLSVPLITFAGLFIFVFFA